eukprot:15088926-Ditylum_brightwellii.AAC.1
MGDGTINLCLVVFDADQGGVNAKDHTGAHNVITTKVIRVNVARVVSNVVEHSVIILDGVHAKVGENREEDGNKGWVISLVVLLCSKGFEEGITSEYVFVTPDWKYALGSTCCICFIR